MEKFKVGFGCNSIWFAILLCVTIVASPGLALHTLNVSSCIQTPTPNENQTAHPSPSCTFQMSKETERVEINCVRPGVLQIVGDYNVFYINCTATYPLDFNFDGHKPTEAIETKSWSLVEENSGGKFKSFHLDIKIVSIPSLHQHFSSLHSSVAMRHRDSFNYSRTGNYTFSGFHEFQPLQSHFYIFFEEKWAVESWIRNEDVRLGLPNYANKTQENAPLIVPCRSSHLNASVSLRQSGNPFAFTYEPTVGFVTNNSWKSIVESNPGMNRSETRFTCKLGRSKTRSLDNFINFSTRKQPSTKYGYEGLPGASSDLLLPNVETLGNGTVFGRYQCSFQRSRNPMGPVTLASIETKNPIEHRLLHLFVLPMFSNRSYSARVVNTVWENGVSDDDIETTALMISALCMDAESYLVESVGVGVTASFIHYTLGQEFASTKVAESQPSDFYFKISHNHPSQELYEKEVVTFRCFIQSFLLIPPAIWYSVRWNGSLVQESIDYEWKNNLFSFVSIPLSKDMKGVVCSASSWHEPHWRNFSLDITVRNSVEPSFDARQPSLQRFPLNSTNGILRCTASGAPQPQIYWQRKAQNISSTTRTTSIGHTSLLEFSMVKEEDEGEYICIASNVASVQRKIFTVQVVTDSDKGFIIGLSVAGFLFLALVICGGIYFRFYIQSTEAGLTKAEIAEFLNGENGGETEGSVEPGNDAYVHELTSLSPYKTEFEVPTTRFSIDTQRVLGSGAYGMVVMGTLDAVPVAVKTVKRNADKMYLKALLSELKVMIFLGFHDNVAGVLGANTASLSKGQVYIFLPFCSLGSLQDYVRNNRHHFLIAFGGYANITSRTVNEIEMTNLKTSELKGNWKSNFEVDGRNAEEITTLDLFDWSVQIAQGMDYLSSRKVIHGDLAARNVLLTGNKIAKITDFGLSRRLYDYSEYAKKQQEPLPWRWMSLESLRDLKFSTKSDVWSYGITLWEIFSLAQVPYPGCSWTMEFVTELEEGLRMAKPHYAPPHLYDLMLDCWHTDPHLRPTFSQILQFFKEHQSC